MAWAFGRLPDTNCTSLWKGWTDTDGKRQRVDSRRIRRTFLELHQRPVAHTAETLADTYLSRDAGSLAANQGVVQRVLETEVERITSGRTALALTDRDIEQAATDANGVAQQFGSRSGHCGVFWRAGLTPWRPPASTIRTTHARNKESYARHLFCSVLAVKMLDPSHGRSPSRHCSANGWRPFQDELPRQRWQQLYGTAAEQLDDLLKQQQADVAAAASRATGEDAALVEALLNGRLDLR